MSGEPSISALKIQRVGERVGTHENGLGYRPCTFAELRESVHWTWVYCARCNHGTPMTLAQFIIRWGPDASSDLLRKSARCTACGHKGAPLSHPGWGGSQVGFLPFPTPAS
jgi:hypothetical protein